MPTATESFVHVKNLQHLRDQLTRTNDDAKCRQIVDLIEAEELKGRLALDGRDHGC